MIILQDLEGNMRQVPEGEPYVSRPGERVVGSTGGQQANKEWVEFEKAFADEGLLLGDAIAKATKAIGFTPCPGCTRRQNWLNEFHLKGRQFVKDLVRQLKE